MNKKIFQEESIDSPEALILIPKNSKLNQTQTIVKGSGIVASLDYNAIENSDLEEDPTYLIDFEANIYNASNLNSPSQKIFHALDRQKTRYPTKARMTLKEDQLKEAFFVVGIVNHQILSKTLGNEENPERLLPGILINPDMQDVFWAWMRK